MQDFSAYLSLVLAFNNEQPDITPIARQAAGLALKAHLETFFPQIPMTIIYFVQKKLQHAFFDQLNDVRKTVCQVMSMIIVRGGFNAWPDLLHFLADQLHDTQTLEDI